MLTQGYQLWTIPISGTYRIEVFGTQGAENGGLGAYVRGDFTLIMEDKLQIIVGQRGTDGTGGTNGGGGGGVGSFVARQNGTLLLAAGGGGEVLLVIVPVILDSQRHLAVLYLIMEVKQMEMEEEMVRPMDKLQVVLDG